MDIFRHAVDLVSRIILEELIVIDDIRRLHSRKRKRGQIRSPGFGRHFLY